MHSNDDTKINLPTFVVEEHRYTEPEDGWVFVTLTPNPERYMGDEQPFGDHDGLYTYNRLLEGWMRTPLAEEIRERLTKDGFTKVAWTEVPDEVFVYVSSCIAPIEWQSDHEFIYDMTAIWVKGEFPMLEPRATL